MIINIFRNHPLMVLFLIALVLRLLFSFYFQQFYFGEFVFKYKDTPGYLNPILNLINHGTYIGDIYLEDSKYFRVPVYPSFLGALYLLVGFEYLDYIVAIVQSIIDSLTVILVYKIILKVTSIKRMAFLSAFIYATYPFVILWSPIMYTEVIQIFLIFVLLYLVLMNHHEKKYTFIAGALVGILILTKQYLGLFLLVPLWVVFFSHTIPKITKKILLISLVFIGMGTVVTPWAVRNYIESGKVIILKAESTGLRARGLDYEAFEKFANLFNENITPMMNEIAYKGTLTFNQHMKFVDNHKIVIDTLAKRAYTCGTSFMEIRIPSGKDIPHEGCDDEIVRGFENLTQQFWNEVSFFTAMETRKDAVKKIFMKSDIVSQKIVFSKTKFFKTLLFKYRVILIFLGFLGYLFIYLQYVKIKEKTFVASLMLTAVSFYVYFSLVIVHVEMRYILVPDILISIFASIPMVFLIDNLKKIFKKEYIYER